MQYPAFKVGQNVSANTWAVLTEEGSITYDGKSQGSATACYVTVCAPAFSHQPGRGRSAAESVAITGWQELAL